MLSMILNQVDKQHPYSHHGYHHEHSDNNQIVALIFCHQNINVVIMQNQRENCNQKEQEYTDRSTDDSCTCICKSISLFFLFLRLYLPFLDLLSLLPPPDATYTPLLVLWNRDLHWILIYTQSYTRCAWNVNQISFHFPLLSVPSFPYHVDFPIPYPS